MATASIKKEANGGAPIAKHKTLIWVPYDSVDHAQFPARDANNVLITGNLVLLDGHKAIGIDSTQSTIKRNDASEGDDDKMAIVQNVEAMHPGNSLAVEELQQNHLGEEGYLITRGCMDNNQTKLHGTPCNPVKLTWEEQDDNDGLGVSFTFKSVQRGKYKSARYKGNLPELAAYADEGSGSAGGGI